MRLTPSFLDGVFLALSTSPSTVMILDSHRCEMERAYVTGGLLSRGTSLVGQGPYDTRRAYAVPWKNALDATGTEDALRQLLLEVAKRHPSGRIAVVRGLMSLIIHTDVRGVLATLPEKIQERTVVIGQHSSDDDWVDGWRAVHDLLMPTVTDADGAGRPVVCGFCVHRMEADELGTISELNRLFGEVGLEEPHWVMGDTEGCPTSVSPDSLHMVFPFGDDPIMTPPDVPRLDLPLPLGFASTVKMMETLGQALGYQDHVHRLVESKRTELQQRLLPSISKGLAGKGAMVVADPWRARGLVTCLEELGVDVPVCVLLRRSDASPSWSTEGDWSRREVLCDPTYSLVQERMEQGAREGLLDIVVGSGMLRDAAEIAGLSYMEIGYPSYLEHFLVPTPFMGFEGIVHLAQRLDTTLGLRRYRRYRVLS